MRTYKYYGTNTSVYGNMLIKIKELGYKGVHNQFRIVCKAKSRAEANRIAEKYELGTRIFVADYTSETGNKIELEMADKHELIICAGGTLGNTYIGIGELIKNQTSQ